MESQLSLLDMREFNGALASTHYPDNVDSAIVSERLRKYVLRFGHSSNTRKISLRHDKTVAVEDFAYSLWTYEAENTTHFAFAVSNGDNEYFSCYSNYDFSAYLGDDGLSIDQFAQWDRLRFTERASILSSYRDLVDVNTRKSSDRFAVALMIWYLHRMLYPGPLEEVVATLTASQAIAPKDIDSWGLLGIVQYRLGNLDAANEAIQRAMSLSDEDPSFIYYAAQIALERGDDRTWESLEKKSILRSKLADRPFTISSNPASRYEDKLLRKAERMHKKIESFESSSEEQIARQSRDAIGIDPKRVPEELHPLIPLALQWGIGDDSARHYFVERASAKDKRALKNALAPLATATNAWLDTFADGNLNDEAAAFFYLLEAAEELQN